MRPARAASAVLLALCSAASLGPVFASTPRELFDGGNSAYEQGRYQEAADAYEKIVAYGVVDPRVLYNLGNSYFKLGKLGSAILCYERSLRLDSSDQDARLNLEFARGLIRDRIQESEIPYPVKVVKDVLDTLPLELVCLVFLGIDYLAASLLASLLFVTGPVRRRVLGYGAVATGLCAILAAGMLYYKIQDRTADHAIVMSDRVDVLSGPSSDNTVLFTVHEGTRLELRNRRDGWYQVSLPNAMSGWVPSESVERV